MILRWGSYSFPDNETWFHITKRAIYSPRGRRMYTRHTWMVTGVKLDETAAGITSQLLALESAAHQDGQDLIFFDNSGAQTAHKLLSNSTINGVQVVGPVNYLEGNPGIWGSGTEYAYKRTYRIVFQGDVLDSTDDLVRYYETIAKTGTGGPLNIWQESMTGVPQSQRPKAFTKCQLIQQGMAIGLTTPQPPSTPLYGNPFIRNDLARTQVGTPLQPGINVDLMWPIHWTYVFESASPL
jgi:hypothetical protein